MLTRNTNYRAAKWPRHTLGIFTPYFACLQHISLENSNHISVGSNLPTKHPLVLFVNDSNSEKTHRFKQDYTGNGDMR